LLDGRAESLGDVAIEGVTLTNTPCGAVPYSALPGAPNQKSSTSCGPIAA
jgi:hypothetical protein